MYCPRCGTQNDDVAKFCKSCGVGLGVAPAGAAAETVPTDFNEVDVVRQDLREEYEIDGEAKRDDANFQYVAAWEFAGVGEEPILHKEPLEFVEVKPTQRSYK